MNKLFGLFLLCLMPCLVGWTFVGEVPAPSGGCTSDIVIAGEKLSAGDAYEILNDYIILSRYQATDTCTIDTLGISINNGSLANIRLAIYTDNSGSVGSLIAGSAESSTSGSTSAEFVEISISDTPITSGDYYWVVGCQRCIRSLLALFRQICQSVWGNAYSRRCTRFIATDIQA